MNLFLHILILKVGFIYTFKCHKPWSHAVAIPFWKKRVFVLPQCWQLKNVLTILGNIEVNVCSMLNVLCSTTLVV